MVEKGRAITSSLKRFSRRRHRKGARSRNDQEVGVLTSAPLQPHGQPPRIPARIQRHADDRFETKRERNGVVRHLSRTQTPDRLAANVFGMDRRKPAARFRIQKPLE